MSPLQTAQDAFNRARADYLAASRHARAGLLGRAQVTAAGQVAYRAQTELDKLRRQGVRA